VDKYKSVFIIEDDPSTARLMRQLIEAEGFLVFIAVNGLEAFEKLDVLDETHKPCLILCDLQMPIMTGWQFSRGSSKAPQSRNGPSRHP